MKIAIIGAGFCGLATAWHLLEEPGNRYQVTIIDSMGIGEGASGVSAGLLHPYAGASAKLNRKGKEGYDAAFHLLNISSRALGRPVFSEDKGVLRLALTERQIHDFKKSNALDDPSVKWLNSDECRSMVQGCAIAPGLWIKSGKSVYSNLYLQGLWLACQQKGALFQKRHISSLNELDDFSLTITAAGALSKQISEFSQIPLKIVKGQILELEWPSSIPVLPCALISQGYLVMKPDKKSCIIGSTYEKIFNDASADLEIAKKLILPKAIDMIPDLKHAKIIGCHAGLRAVTPDHLPLSMQVNARHWILTGMGSKGLLYHALMAQELVKAIKTKGV